MVMVMVMVMAWYGMVLHVYGIAWCISMMWDNKNFRPVDMEFAPDGSLYMVD